MNALVWIGMGILSGFAVNFRKQGATNDAIAESSILGVLGGLISGFIFSFYYSTGMLDINLITFLASFAGALLFSTLGKQFARGV